MDDAIKKNKEITEKYSDIFNSAPFQEFIQKSQKITNAVPEVMDKL